MAFDFGIYPNHLKHGFVTRRRPEFEPNEVGAEAAKLNKLSDAGGLKCSGCPTPSQTNASGRLGIKRVSHPFFLLLIISLGKMLLLGALLATPYLGLSPDEAQYWTWSQALDWGYYSKPPGIAWQIWASTHLLGNTPLGVRAGALLIGFLLTLALYRLARAARLSPTLSAWSGVVFALSPLGFYLSLAATTDGGSILFFVLATTTVVQGIQHTKTNKEWPRYYYEVALWIFCGACFKWTAFLFWPFVLLTCFWQRKLHPNNSWSGGWVIRHLSLIVSLLLSCLALLPSLYWNASHEWATFKHVAGALGHGQSNFFAFLVAQVALLSPIFSLLLLWSYFRLHTTWHTPSFQPKPEYVALSFCACFPAALLVYAVAACFTKIQPNWAAYLYPSGMLLIPWVAAPKHMRWLYGGTCLSLLIVGIALVIPWLQQKEIGNLPYRVNPLRQCMGWDHLPKILDAVGYDPEDAFLMSDKYQTTSILSFYGPKQKRAYFVNLNQIRKNQFSYWPQLESQELGKNGYFVLCENTDPQSLPWYTAHYTDRLAPFFASVTYLGAYPLYSVRGVPVKYAILFHGVQYNGRTIE